jgi:CheY-like chemotaxis protein
MDLGLPLLDGYEATEEILKFDPKAIIIAQTTYIGKKENEKCLAIGFKGFYKNQLIKIPLSVNWKILSD